MEGNLGPSQYLYHRASFILFQIIQETLKVVLINLEKNTTINAVLIKLKE